MSIVLQGKLSQQRVKAALLCQGRVANPRARAAEFTNGLHRFDPASAEWANLSGAASAGAPPSSRMGVPAVGAGGRLYLFGGYIDSGTLHTSLRLLYPGTEKGATVPGEPRFGYSAAAAAADVSVMPQL